MTRFLVLGKGELRPTGNDRTSLVMSAPNRPGAVLELISPFAQNGVSMTRIESRPARTGQWEYLFFVDIDGHQADVAVAKALGDIRMKAPRCWGVIQQHSRWPNQSRRVASARSKQKFTQVNMDICELSPAYIRAIAPYQQGKPISELAREMGLDETKIVKLASDEIHLECLPARWRLSRRNWPNWHVIRMAMPLT